MSVEVMSMVLHHSASRGTDKLVLLGIANHEGDGGAWPAIRTLATYANASERTVQRSIERLIDAGELIRHLQAGGTRDQADALRTNLYRVCISCPQGCSGGPSHRVTHTSPGDAHVTRTVLRTIHEPPTRRQLRACGQLHAGKPVRRAPGARPSRQRTCVGTAHLRREKTSPVGGRATRVVLPARQGRPVGRSLRGRHHHAAAHGRRRQEPNRAHARRTQGGSEMTVDSPSSYAMRIVGTVPLEHDPDLAFGHDLTMLCVGRVARRFETAGTGAVVYVVTPHDVITIDADPVRRQEADSAAPYRPLAPAPKPNILGLLLVAQGFFALGWLAGCLTLLAVM